MDAAIVQALAQSGYSRRKIAKLLGVSRNTLRKYLKPPGEADSQPPAAGRPGKLDSFLSDLRKVIETNPKARAMEIYRRLRELGYSGGYDLVKKRVRELRRDNLQGGPAPAPGQRAEVDFGRLELAGNPCFLFSMLLTHSGKIFARLVPSADMDTFLDCHQRAFRFFQGVTREVVYNVVGNKWIKKLAGGNRFNLPLVRLAGHYGFSMREAPPRAPWAAGRLKRPLRLVEVQYLRGRTFNGLEEANTGLLAWLLDWENFRAQKFRDNVGERFSREQPRLGSLPAGPFAKTRLKMLSQVGT